MSVFKTLAHNTRLINIAFGIIYIYLFRGIYTEYLVPTMGYMGYELNNLSPKDIAICDLLCLIPLLFYSVEVRLSNFIAIMIYIFMYVPSQIAIQYFWGCAYHIDYMLAFFVGMILFFVASRNSISKKIYLTKVGKLKLSYFVAFGFVCALTLLFIYRNNLHMVSFADVYDLREENNDLGKDFALAGYFHMWCQNLFSPLLMAVGLYKNNKKYILLGILLSLLIYTSSGLKSSIIMPVVIIGFYYYMKRYMTQSIISFFPLFTLLIGVIYLSSFFFTGSVATMAYSIVFMRSIGIAAELAPCYITVFDSHPYTYYSHVNIINKITGQYPFDNPSIGNAVWDAYSGNDANNANANFWLTDGTAAAGVIGVLIISVFFYFLLVYLNKFSNAHDRTTVFSMLIPIIIALTNASIFTTLLSGGLIIGMIILRYCHLSSFEEKALSLKSNKI